MPRFIARALVSALFTLSLVACGDSSSTSDPEGAAVTRSAGTAYPGDGATKAELARWMGAGVSASGLPPELPVMAALDASGLSNLRGDADSAGFFQMRVGVWNKGQYAGFPDKPDLQLKWFVDQALAVKSRRTAAGIDSGDPTTWGEWIADVERPAAQLRGRYQLRLAEARRLLRR